MNDLLDYLKNHFQEYDFHPHRDPRYFNILAECFPNANLLDELRAFHIWTLDTNITSNYRSRFYRWLQKSHYLRSSNS